MLKVLLLSLLICACLGANSQVVVKGPNCAIPGVEYQYVFENAKRGEKLTVCLTDGVVAGTVKECMSGELLFIRVKWSGTKKKGGLTVEAPSGKASYNVTFTASLNGGNIESSFKKQDVQKNNLAIGIACSNASGGGCSAVYQYQWQRSIDKTKWEDIAGETKTDLRFKQAFSQTTFFRRRVVDATSGTEAYSNEAAVFMVPDMENKQ